MYCQKKGGTWFYITVDWMEEDWLNDWRSLVYIAREKSVVSPEDPVMTFWLIVHKNIYKMHLGNRFHSGFNPIRTVLNILIHSKANTSSIGTIILTQTLTHSLEKLRTCEILTAKTKSTGPAKAQITCDWMFSQQYRCALYWSKVAAKVTATITTGSPKKDKANADTMHERKVNLWICVLFLKNVLTL